MYCIFLDSTNLSVFGDVLNITTPHLSLAHKRSPNMASFYSSEVEMLPIGLAIFFIFVFILYKFLINNKKPVPDQLGLPPGPRPWPIVGNLHLLGSLPHQSLAKLAKKYGHIMFLRLGSVPTVVVSSPAMAKEFLKSHDLLFANRPPISAGKYLVYDRKDVAFAPYGEYWRQMRKLCTIELFTLKRTKSFRCVREEEVSAMVRSIWLESRQGIRCVDLRNRLSSLTQNIICRMFASRTFSDDELSGGHSFNEMFSQITAVSGAFCTGDFIPFLDWLDLQGVHRRMQAVQKIFDGFAEKVIDEHVTNRREKSNAEQQHRGKDMVDILLDTAESEIQKEMKITRLHIKGIIMDILTAAVESSITTVEWAMCELLRNHRVMAIAQREIESVVGRHRFLKESDVASCEYFRCVVKETFRLHPPVPLLLPHESMGACSVDKYYIPPKTMLFVNVWAIGRDESVWENPLQFKPERLMGKEIDVKGQDFELLPFGAGRRGCPAISMGLSIVELTLAELIHCFDWSVEGEVNMDEGFGVTAPKKIPLLACPSWRLTTENNSISSVTNFGK